MNELDRKVCEAFKSAFKEKLTGLIVHGSAAKLQYIEGFSDYDVIALLSEEATANNKFGLQRAVSKIDPNPFSYIQLSRYILPKDRGHYLVDHSFRVIYGEPDTTNLLISADELRQKGNEWLELVKVSLYQRDINEWSTAQGETITRLIRLIWTRLLPAVRALLVNSGQDPIKAWSSPLNDLIKSMHQHHPELGMVLEEIVKGLPPTQESAVQTGELMLILLARLIN